MYGAGRLIQFLLAGNPEYFLDNRILYDEIDLILRQRCPVSVSQCRGYVFTLGLRMSTVFVHNFRPQFSSSVRKSFVT